MLRKTVKTWQGKATIESVHDGDTVTASIDLGFNVWIRTKLRIKDAWAPELTEPGGDASRQFLEGFLPAGTVVTVLSHRLDKYGRAEATLTMEDGTDVAKTIIATGHAKAQQ